MHSRLGCDKFHHKWNVNIKIHKMEPYVIHFSWVIESVPCCNYLVITMKSGLKWDNGDITTTEPIRKYINIFVCLLEI